MRGKNALVTGASRKAGIGAAIANALAEVGANIFVTYYRPYDVGMPWGSEGGEVEGLITHLRGRGVKAEGLELDLSKPEAARELFDCAESLLGPIDILVNNAAHSEPDGLENLTADMLDRHYGVNVRGTVLLCTEFARRFKKDEGGRIVNLTSGQSLGAMPNELAYAATKGAVEAFTTSLSAALAPRGITVNAVDPGATDTGWMSDNLKTELKARAPMGRVGLPSDAASLVRFLASDDASWITGQVICSQGGL